MRNNWKISVFFACLAFGVSFLFGIIGGVGFGTVILRAFLGAILFAGLGFAVEFFLHRALPDLFAPAGESGSVVDITQPQTNPYEHSSGGDFTEGAGADVEAFQDDGTAADEADDLVEEIEEIPRSEADGVAGAQSADPAEAVGDFDELDELDASFAAAAGAAGGDVAAPASRASAKAAIAEDQNPALLAKVLQTVLKRDEG
ncbi:MAG: hypothetical protein LBT33_09590 [Spirochaetia bacterium]|jgi:hypothetical protein|nr:hypothetical protein [Spirochaetia bacterium]